MSMNIESVSVVPNELLPVDLTVQKPSDLSVSVQGSAPNTVDKFSNWINEKPKYLLETGSNIAAYAAIFFQNFPIGANFGYVSKTLGDYKSFFSVIDAVKGSIEFVNNVANKTYKSVWDAAGSLGYIIGDGLDIFKALKTGGIYTLGKTAEKVVGVVKNGAALFSLSRDIHKASTTLDKLAKLDPAHLPNVEDSKKPQAKEIKAEWIKAETNRVWWERVKNMSGAALCSLGLVGAFFAFPVAGIAGTVVALTFATIGTFGLSGKLMTHFSKIDGNFQQNRMAQLLQARLA